MSIGWIPHVMENINGNDHMVTLDDWLLIKKRTICISGTIDTETAHQTVNKLFYLADKSDDPIAIYFKDCPGGSVTAGMAIYDAMQYVDCEISTVCMGMCASMGAFLFAAGTKGKRYMMPNSKVMIHQPSAGTSGVVTDMEINLEHFQQVKQRLNTAMAKHTGKSESQIKHDSERDYWLFAEEAVTYGLADAILIGTKGKEMRECSP